jgi:hypothetical protein
VLRALVSPRERFRAFLDGAGVFIDETIMTAIARSGNLSSRVPMVSNIEDALALYADGSVVPRTETRAMALEKNGIIIDGDMPVGGGSTAMFFYAFKRNVPHVFKVPHVATQAAKECALWQHVKEAAADAPDVYLVPVEYVLLKEGARHSVKLTEGRSEDKFLTDGILMPAYAATIDKFPVPIDEGFARIILGRMEPTIRFINAHGWLHGDVKPSNIFLDYKGDVWLGDFGSSVTLLDMGKFQGGTFAFQCEDLDAATDPLRFDLTGLVITIVALLGLLKPRSGIAWPRAAVVSAVERVTNAELRRHLAVLLGNP